MSYERMPCRISDGPQTPEEAEEQWERWATIDEDAAYEEQRQIEIDAEFFAKGADKQ